MVGGRFSVYNYIFFLKSAHTIFSPFGDLIGILSVSELTFDQVVKILKVSIFVGIMHLLLAFGLRVRENWKRGNKFAIYVLYMASSCQGTIWQHFGNQDIDIHMRDSNILRHSSWHHHNNNNHHHLSQACQSERGLL